MESIIGALLGLLAVAGVIGLIVVVVIVFGIVWGIRRARYALKGETYQPLIGGKVKNHEYEHLDVDAGATAERIERVLRKYRRDQTLGKRADSGINALESERHKSASFYGVLDNKFPKTSLSWGKFSTAGEAAHDGILRNCASLANDIQQFNPSEYRRLKPASPSLWPSKQASIEQNSTQLEQYRLMETKLSEMDNAIASSEKLLLELDKLTVELDALDDADSSERSERIVEEIRTLIDETKYYK